MPSENRSRAELFYYLPPLFLSCILVEKILTHCKLMYKSTLSQWGSLTPDRKSVPQQRKTAPDLIPGSVNKRQGWGHQFITTIFGGKHSLLAQITHYKRYYKGAGVFRTHRTCQKRKEKRGGVMVLAQAPKEGIKRDRIQTLKKKGKWNKVKQNKQISTIADRTRYSEIYPVLS